MAAPCQWTRILFLRRFSVNGNVTARTVNIYSNFLNKHLIFKQRDFDLKRLFLLNQRRLHVLSSTEFCSKIWNLHTTTNSSQPYYKFNKHGRRTSYCLYSSESERKKRRVVKEVVCILLVKDIKC